VWAIPGFGGGGGGVGGDRLWIDSLHSFKLDDLVRDPSFNFLNKLSAGEDELGHTHDFLGTDLIDSHMSLRVILCHLYRSMS
jgi:hypothetical protein